MGIGLAVFKGRQASVSALTAGALAVGMTLSGLGSIALAQAGSGGMAQGGGMSLALPPAPLLPGTLGKLSRVAEGDVGDGLGALKAADFDATERGLLTEDGIKRYARSDYTDGPEGKGSPQGSVTVYKFGDASGAVAAFDALRKPGPARVGAKLADAVASDGKGVLLRSGVNVVRSDLKLTGPALETTLKELVGHLPKVGGPAGLAPLLPGLLPAKGLEADSVGYALGPVGYTATGGVLPAASAGFDKSAETVTAKYRGQGTLTLALYPTPQIAGDHARAAEAALKASGAPSGEVQLRREGSLVVFTSGAWTPEAAKAMTGSLHLRQEVTFDKPMPLEFHAEVRKTYSLLQSIAIFCGVGAAAAIVLGLFLGGGRALIRVAQGKPAATEPEFLRIDLRDKGNPGSEAPEQRQS